MRSLGLVLAFLDVPLVVRADSEGEHRTLPFCSALPSPDAPSSPL